MHPKPLITPSLLAADFAKLGDEVRAVTAAGADWLHLDIMDGHFVPNISFGPGLIKALRRHTTIPFDVHLMIAPVDPYLQAFADAGADLISLHPEAGAHLHRSLQTIRGLGKKAGVVLNPATPIAAIEHVLDLCDLILVMSVNPGFGGQSFLESQLPKIEKLRRLIEASGRDIRLQVDGGVTAKTAPLCLNAGADVLVAGTAVFGAPDYAAAIKALRGGGGMINLLRGARQKLARLRPVRVPDAPARPFRDLWPGDAARGARLLRGEADFAGTIRPMRLLAEGGEPWGGKGASPAWRAAAHGFAWMRDLRALGTDAARLRARALTADWLQSGWEEDIADAPEVVGARISAWLGHWDFFAATAEDVFRRQVMQRLAQDARDLVGALPAEEDHRGALVALKGALAAAVALEEDAYLQRAIRFLPAEIERQFLPDGGHVERSPAQQLAALQDLIEIRNLLHGVGVEAPPHLMAALDRAAPALRLFRHGDGGLALFNGAREENSALLDLVLTQGQARGRGALELPETGFQRLQAGRSVIIMDAGPPPRGRGGATGLGGLPSGADRFAHAGTLSFEMSVGRDRLIVNCGAAPAGEEGWRDALRATAAHSTLVLSDTNSSELRAEGLGRKPETIEVERQEATGAQWLEVSHDGWRGPFGAVHRRRLYLAESGDDLRGEDVLELPADAPIPIFVARFHLHPAVTANLLQDESAVLLRLASGAGWKLRAKGARVALEDSIYLGGEARRSLQIVLYAEENEVSLQWAITRVSLPGAAPIPGA